MNGRVGDLRSSVSAAISLIEADGCLESVFLRAVIHLNVVKDDVTFTSQFQSFKEIYGHNLTTPSVSIFSINLNVTSKKKHLSTDVNSIVEISSRSCGTIMVVPKGCVLARSVSKSNDSLRDSSNRSELTVVVLDRGRSYKDLITNDPVDSRVYFDLGGTRLNGLCHA